MPVDYQVLFNVAFSLAGMLGGFLLKTFHDALKELRKRDEEIMEKMLGHYVHKDEFNRMTDAIFAKLDKMDEKLDKLKG